MTKLLRSFAALALLAAAPVRAAPDRVEATPALFKVSDSDTTIYLFPTVALSPPDVDWLRGPVREAFDHADQLLVEVDPVEGPSRSAAAIQRLGAFPAVVPLRSRMSVDAYGRLLAFQRKFDFPEDMLGRAKPWYAAMTVGALCMFGRGEESLQSPIKLLESEATNRGIRIDGLETIDAQLSRVDAMPEQLQIDLLLRNLDTCDGAKSEFKALLALWSEGDLNGLDAAMRSDPAMARVMPLVADYRNPLWAEWIAKRLDRPGTAFVMGSAGNFAGSNSVLVELERGGLAVTRVQ